MIQHGSVNNRQTFPEWYRNAGEELALMPVLASIEWGEETDTALYRDDAENHPFLFFGDDDDEDIDGEDDFDDMDDDFDDDFDDDDFDDDDDDFDDDDDDDDDYDYEEDVGYDDFDE
jgi:hypothetical protein